MFLFSKISLTIFFILTMTVIAEAFGVLSQRYANYILLVGTSIQMIMLIALVISLLIRKGELKRGVKIIRHKIEDKYIKGNTDLLPSFIGSTNPRKAAIFQIYIEAKDFKENPCFNMCKTVRGGPEKMIDIKKHILRVNTSIVDDLFIFVADLIVRPDEKVNFKFENDINIKTFFIGELYIP
jgi:hypothetical protein